MSPLAAVSTPPVPLFCSLRFSRILLKRGSWTPQRIESISLCVLPLPPACVLNYPAEEGQADVHPGPESGAQVGRAGEDVSQTLVPHELPASLLNQLLHLKVSNKLSHHREKHIYIRCYICNSCAEMAES